MILALALLAQSAAGPAAPAPSLAYPKADIINCAVTDDADSLLCRAAEASRQNRYADSAGLFEQGAEKLGAGAEARRDEALAAAGNMWIAAGDPVKAGALLDRAVAGGGLGKIQLGQAHIDGARAAEARGDLKSARAKVREAAKYISQDPYLWYFSAALAVREDDIPTAKSAINRALSIVPDAPELLFEAGHIAHAAGEDGVAREYWNRTVKVDPNGPNGAAARRALALSEVPLTVTNEVAKLPNGDGEEGRQN